MQLISAKNGVLTYLCRIGSNITLRVIIVVAPIPANKMSKRVVKCSIAILYNSYVRRSFGSPFLFLLHRPYCYVLPVEDRQVSMPISAVLYSFLLIYSLLGSRNHILFSAVPAKTAVRRIYRIFRRQKSMLYC